MAGYPQALEWVDKLNAALPSPAIATCDPRSATPPCVFITHRAGDYVTSCSARVGYEVALLVPGTANVDAWNLLDALEPIVAELLPVVGYQFLYYRLALDAPPLPAYLFTFSEDCEI